MGQGASGAGGRPDGLTAPGVLAGWEESGAHWRVVERRPGRAAVELLACTGEPVDRLEVEEADALAYLRDRPASEGA